MPTSEQIRQFVVGTVIPPLAGAIASLLASSQILNIFNISHDQLASAITGGLVFGVTTLIGFLVSHHILSGTYSGTSK